MLIIDHLSKNFGKVEAVRDLSLTVKQGEILGFLGLNGAGKTTTIKLIAGLLKPTAGYITIDGHDVHKEPVLAKQSLAYIPDDPYLYDKMTGYECLQLVGALHHVPVADIKPRIEELLSLFAIEQYAHQLTENYSHGTKQKFVFATALLHRPRLMLIDEPMVGLDPQNAHLVKTLLKKIATENQVTIFVSTHTLSLAEEICDRIGIIHEGALLTVGTLPELKQAAAEREMNLEALFLKLTRQLREGKFVY